MKIKFSLFFLLLCRSFSQIVIDGSKLSSTFDGIGGLSAGASSRLLIDYKEPYRSQILDYFFKPNFGASLHILKVEIGGDCQSTDGTEASHMPNRNELNFARGYEWWLMLEAKKRNPDIKIYALSWGVPGWIGDNVYFSDDNVDYHTKWVQGAKKYYNIDVHYIGIWNERQYTNDANCTFVKKLRSSLDIAGFQNTKIVIPDGWGWDQVSDTIQKDPLLSKAVDVVGMHYPNSMSSTKAQTLSQALWASEDFSTYANYLGDGCWARLLNQNWVLGKLTSTISWSLIAAWYPGLPFTGCGLSFAWYPWSGSFSNPGTMWISAHIGQFSQPGWKYLEHGSGSGWLPKGGSYSTLVPPNNTKNHFSIIIETITKENGQCLYSSSTNYATDSQTVTFDVHNLNDKGPYHIWYTHISNYTSQAVYFNQLPDIVPQNGQFTLKLDLNSVISITTTTGQQKGSYPPPPQPAPFLLPYSDDFESYDVDKEAKYFSDQTGTWVIFQSKSGKTMRQVVQQRPISWCTDSQSPITIIGDSGVSNVEIQFDTLIETVGSTTLAARVVGAGCTNNYKTGYFLTADQTGHWTLFSGVEVLTSGNSSSWKPNNFNNMKLTLVGNKITAFINDLQVAAVTNSAYQAGFVAVGSSFNYIQFDNFKMTPLPINCGVGTNAIVAACFELEEPYWIMESDGTVRKKSNTSLCLDIGGLDPHSQSPNVIITPCNPGKNPNQIWAYDQRKLIHKASNKCLDITGASKLPCSTVEVYQCVDNAMNQEWMYNSDIGVLMTLQNNMCLSLGPVVN